MKDLIIPFKNWRVSVLTVLSFFAAIFIVCETDEKKGIGFLLLIKAMGFGLAYIIYIIGKYWHSKGKINELKALDNED